MISFLYRIYEIVRRIFDILGFHFLRKSYYLPIPDISDLPSAYFQRQSDMSGVRIDDRIPLAFLNNIFPPYLAEFRAMFPLHKNSTSGNASFYLINSSYMAIDAHVYYAFIRHFKPRTVIEIGGGNSSVLAGAALQKNTSQSISTGRLVVIEPYPSPQLQRGFPGLSELIGSKIQDVPLSTFTALEAGDILFIDSSHVLRSGGDVQYEYLEILPRLAPGVLVHIHDISLPKHYPKVYFDSGMYWNEQYLLQAFLAFNSRFEVIWPGNYLMTHRPEILRKAFPEFDIMRQSFPSSEPTAFWMRVIP